MTGGDITKQDEVLAKPMAFWCYHLTYLKKKRELEDLNIKQSRR